ncbi:MAG: penicillin-binding protein, partial [Erysipelotrichaceae bacterium]|nr:penicillin-binding protein [Erysipelotrichaceae bacterium]
GISLKGTLRAIYNNLVNNTTQGGSTITQQLSRSLYLDNEKTVYRKIKEALLAIRLETHYDKRKIIEEYLNNIYLGHDIYGIQQASYYYFSKDNLNLKLDEICMIVGIASAPNIYAPDIDYNKALSQRNYVLSRMNKLKFIDRFTYEKYLNKNTIMNYQKETQSVFYPLFFYATNYLKKYDLYTKENKALGIKIYTTIDKDIQEKIYSIISSNNPNDNSEVSAVILNSFSGDILAFLGGYQLNDSYNRAFYAMRPIGSTIKPLLYYLALTNNISPLTFLSCKKTTFNIKGYGSFTPNNATNKYADDKINMIEAIALSDNIYATKTLLLLGFESFANILNKFDINAKIVPSSALGVDETTLLHLTSIYNCFASLGRYYYPRMIKKITTNDGQILHINNEKSKQALYKPYVFVLNQLLTAPFDKNAIDYTFPTLFNYQTNVKYGAKTGSDSYNTYTIGFNPTYTIGIWCGTDDNTPLMYKNLAKVFFQEIANSLDTNNLWYNPPSYIKEIKIDPISALENEKGSIYWVINNL